MSDTKKTLSNNGAIAFDMNPDADEPFKIILEASPADCDPTTFNTFVTCVAVATTLLSIREKLEEEDSDEALEELGIPDVIYESLLLFKGAGEHILDKMTDEDSPFESVDKPTLH